MNWVQNGEAYFKGDLIVGKRGWGKKRWEVERMGGTILRGKLFADSRPGTGGVRKYKTAEAAMKAADAAAPEAFAR